MSKRSFVWMLLACMAFGGFAKAQAPNPTFTGRKDYVDTPQAGATGDFNGDGIQDIVYMGGTPVVLLGNGDGTFQPPLLSDYSFMGGNGLAVADLNGDGILDLVSGIVTGNLQVGYGNGDGTFEGGPVFKLDKVPISITVADINGDGLPDILVSTKGLLVFLNQGGGVFGPYTNLLPGRNVQATAVADLNGDGIADIVVGEGEGATVLLGTGGGAFVTGETLALQHTAGSLVLQDMDGDGKLDLVASAGIYTPYWTEVTVLAGDGAGGFNVETQIPFPAGCYGVTVGDIDGDGVPDIAVLQASIEDLAVAFGRGKGQFGTPLSFVTGTGDQFLALAQFRTPGQLDAVSFAPLGYTLSVLLNNGRRGFQDGTRIPFPEPPGALVSADFDGDGLNDLAVATSSGISVFRNTGKLGTPFAAIQTIALTSPVYLVTADFNGDGRPDLAAALASGDVAILLGFGNGEFGPPTTVKTGGTLTNYPYTMVAGDFNNDGKVDLVTSLNRILFGNGDGTFEKAQPLIRGYFTGEQELVAMAAGDLNNDGNLDLAVIEAYGHGLFRTLLNNGAGQFSVSSESYEPSAGVTQPALADLNGDGKLDVVLMQVQTYVLLGKGDGTFAPPIAPYYLNGAVGVAIADFNGDGNLDFAVSGVVNGDIAIFLGQGDGTFTTPSLPLGSTYVGTAAGATYLLAVPLRGQKMAAKPDLITSADDGVDIAFNTTP